MSKIVLEEENIIKKLKIFVKTHKNWIIFALLFIVCMASIIFLPQLSEVLYGILRHNVVKSGKMNIGRLDLLKIYMSLIGPILTFLVFRNTVNIQNEAREDRKNDKIASTERKNADDANLEFYGLLELFKKEQDKCYENKIIFNLYNVGIIGDYDLAANYADYNLGFKNSYKFENYLGFLKQPAIKIDFEKNKFGKVIKIPKYEGKVIKTKDEIVEEIISMHYQDAYFVLGTYLKVLHRIIKSLNMRLETEILDDNTYNSYIGILRAQLSSEELVVLLVNSLYIKKGTGLGIELTGAGLFGDEIDINVNQHFDVPAPEIKQEDLNVFIYSETNMKKREAYRLKFNKKRKNGFTEFDLIRNFKSLLNL